MQEALFYEFSIDRHVPSDHLLRSINRFVDLSGLRSHLRPFYSEIGRPSIDPELMIRMLIVGYCIPPQDSTYEPVPRLGGNSLVATARIDAIIANERKWAAITDGANSWNAALMRGIEFTAGASTYLASRI